MRTLIALFVAMIVFMNDGEVLRLEGWGMKTRQGFFVFYEDGKCRRGCDMDLIIPHHAVKKIVKPNYRSPWS